MNFIYLYFYIACCAGEEFVEKYFVRSYRLEPVLSNIFAILFVEGQRGCPYLDQRLLLLKVVASNPLRFANPEQDTLCSLAKESMANQTSACVILKLLGFVCCWTRRNYRLGFYVLFYTLFTLSNV